jgi:hypothetical protein
MSRCENQTEIYSDGQNSVLQNDVFQKDINREGGVNYLPLARFIAQLFLAHYISEYGRPN